jgi:GT2 family glycosyltransferase
VTAAVITIVKGRRSHLRAHLSALTRSDLRSVDHIVVAMGDPSVKTTVEQVNSPAHVVDIEHSAAEPLPLARARNIGAAHALHRGADILVFLDVDCIASPQLVQRYRTAAKRNDCASALLCGPVTYLPAPVDGSSAINILSSFRNPHRARPAPADTRITKSENYDLFWSLSFAVTASTWRSLPGFCEDYAGYGGEDTDFAWTARTQGVGLRWIGGADAYHQFHPVSDPPLEHLDDILVNAHTFYRRWRRWPMEGWLRAFEEKKLIEYLAHEQRWAIRKRI